MRRGMSVPGGPRSSWGTAWLVLCHPLACRTIEHWHPLAAEPDPGGQEDGAPGPSQTLALLLGASEPNRGTSGLKRRRPDLGEVTGTSTGPEP